MGDVSMLALGSCLAGAGILVACLLALLFRHPNAPRWTRPEIVALLACVPVAVAIGVGLGYVMFGVSQLLRGDGDPRELLVLVGAVIVLALAWRGLRIRERLKNYAIATGGSSPSADVAPAPTPVTEATPPPPPPTAHARPQSQGG
jgi:hypothetical protein